MVIETKNNFVNVVSVESTKINRHGKTYPALKFVFPGEVTAADISELTSGEMTINGYEHNGYNTLGEVSVIVGKITTAEEERDAIQAERDAMRENVNIILPMLDDNAALRVMSLYPAWEPGTAYAVGDRFVYGDTLYRVITAHTSQADWKPDTAATLYTVINETHAGTADDPIPYDGNMALENGKYYVQDDVLYLCSRDTGTPVYNLLEDLVGVYVEVV